jgi:hypothetical protein
LSNNRFDLTNPLARNLQEQQCKLRAKPFGPDLQVKRMLEGPCGRYWIKEK